MGEAKKKKNVLHQKAGCWSCGGRGQNDSTAILQAYRLTEKQPLLSSSSGLRTAFTRPSSSLKVLCSGTRQDMANCRERTSDPRTYSTTRPTYVPGRGSEFPAKTESQGPALEPIGSEAVEAAARNPILFSPSHCFDCLVPLLLQKKHVTSDPSILHDEEQRMRKRIFISSCFCPLASHPTDNAVTFNNNT